MHVYPYLHDACANKNVHVLNAPRTTHSETHLETQNTTQQKTTTQGHAARAICLCINSYKSAEQMTMAPEVTWTCV